MSDQVMKLGISTCLYGEHVRYDGGKAKTPPLLKQMLKDFSFEGYCPEVAAGMGTPRESIRIIDMKGEKRVISSKTSTDWTKPLNEASDNIVQAIQQSELRGYVLKSKSPSCGLSSAKVFGQDHGQAVKSSGLFTDKLQAQTFIPLIEAEMLNCNRMADKFLRLCHLADDFYKLEQALTKQALLKLWSENKLSVMAASPAHYRRAGKLLSNLKDQDLKQTKDELYCIMYEGLNRLSSTGRHVNALMHLQGYFKKFLSSAEKRELSDIITQYAKGFIPLAVPITMIKHYLLNHPDEYLLQQNYIFPRLEHYGLRNTL